MNQRLIVFFILLTICSWLPAQDNESLADNYYKEGDFDKALILYKELYRQKPYSYNYLFKLVETHQQLENYLEAQHILKNRLERRPNPSLFIALGYNYQLQDSIATANRFYDKAIQFVEDQPNYIYTVARKFEDYSLLENAIAVYNKAQKLTPDRNYDLQLARIYGEQGDVEAMFNNYLSYIKYKPVYLNNIKRVLSEFVSEDRKDESNQLLKRLLLKRIQQQPSAYWYDMLSWLYVQEKAYRLSFIQEKALYKRNNANLDRVIDLGFMAMNDQHYEVALEVFQFILKATQDASTQLRAHEQILAIKTQLADEKDLDRIKKDYDNLFTTYGINPQSLELQLAYAKFLAFNMNQVTEADDFLKNSLELYLSATQQAEVKLVLADILVLQERFNEALIYYSQIQTNLKNSTLAQEARFRVAKTSFYKGDFKWAETQLNVLKSSTSQLIANDALELKLLISDNKYQDSTQTALKAYAKADLLAFQNKTKVAIGILNEIKAQHREASIIPQTLFKQAQLYEELKQFDKAETNYLEIISKHTESILMDDAHFHLAQLYDKVLLKKDEAKFHYEQIIFNHEDSIYFVAARNNFRRLRGDRIN